MKKVMTIKLVCLVFLMFSVTYSFAETVTFHLTWEASTDNVGVTGYRIHHVTSMGSDYAEAEVFDVGNILEYNHETEEGLHCYKVTAFDAAGNESLLRISPESCALGIVQKIIIK